MKSEETKSIVIEKLTELLIKQDFKDREKGTDTYIKKTRIYKDLIYMFKELI